VAVATCRDGGRGVPEDALHHRQRNPCLEQERGRGVAQVVEAGGTRLGGRPQREAAVPLGAAAHLGGGRMLDVATATALVNPPLDSWARFIADLSSAARSTFGEGILRTPGR
jgi:hypothetical protein